MVWCKGLGVLERFHWALIALGFLVAGLPNAYATPLTEVQITGKDGKPTSFLSVLKQFGTFTPEQESVLDKIPIPYTSAERADAFIKSMDLPSDPYLAKKFAEKFDAMKNGTVAGPTSVSAETLKVLKIFRDSALSDEEDLPRESALPIANANIPKPGSSSVTLNDAIAHYQDLEAQSPAKEEQKSPFNLDEDQADDELEQEAITPPVLGECAKDDTVRIKNEYRINEGPKGIRFDSLFVAADSPLEEKLQSQEELALIGETTALFPYRSEPADLLSLKAVEYGATCLPFRIRVTDKFIYFHSGEDALKNYDKNPDGNGIVPKQAPVPNAKTGGDA